MSRTDRPLRVPQTAAGALLPVLLLTLLVTGCGAPAAVGAEVTRTLESRAALAPGALLKLENLAGRIEVRPAAGGEVLLRATVHAESAALADRLRFDLEETDGKLEIDLGYPVNEHREYVYPEANLPRVLGFRTTVRSEYRGTKVTVHGRPNGKAVLLFADLEIELPEGARADLRTLAGTIRAERVAGELRLDTGRGDITARAGEGGLEIDTGSGAVEVTSHRGKVAVDTGSGSVRLEGVEGDVEIDTGSGGVKLVKVRGGKIAADTGSGGIELTEVEGALRLDTGSGSIRGTGLLARDEVAADTGSGGIHLEGDFSAVRRLEVGTGSGGVTLGFTGTPPALRYEIRTGSGGIDVDLPGLRTEYSKRGTFSGTVADGTAGDARIETGSGSVTVQPAS
jgi:hypothetical protein